MSKTKFIYSFICTKLLVFTIINKYECTIYIPFKILEESNINNNYLYISDIIKYLKEPKIYSELLIGTPPQKLGVFYTQIFMN